MRARDGPWYEDEHLMGLSPSRCVSGSAAYVYAEFRRGLFFALCLHLHFFLFISLSRIVRFDPTFHAPRDASVANALGALGPCHALRLSPMTAFYAKVIAPITAVGFIGLIGILGV